MKNEANNGAAVERKLLSKREMATSISMKSRWLNLRMREGLPHLKIGARRTLFDADEVICWLKKTYGRAARS